MISLNIENPSNIYNQLPIESRVVPVRSRPITGIISMIAFGAGITMIFYGLYEVNKVMHYSASYPPSDTIVPGCTAFAGGALTAFSLLCLGFCENNRRR